MLEKSHRAVSSPRPFTGEGGENPQDFRRERGGGIDIFPLSLPTDSVRILRLSLSRKRARGI